MFQSLRPSSQVFILNRSNDITLDRGTVVSVSNPVPKYQIPPVFGQPQEMVVDLVVKINGHDSNYQKLPATADIADFGTSGIVISDSREAMNAEVISLKQRSLDALNEMDRHRETISRCDSILSTLNPEFAEKQAQQAEINELKQQMHELMEMNRSMMRQLQGSEASLKHKCDDDDSTH